MPIVHKISVIFHDTNKGRTTTFGKWPWYTTGAILFSMTYYHPSTSLGTWDGEQSHNSLTSRCPNQKILSLGSYFY